MNVLLWILQVLLAIHTAIGAVWKWSNSEHTLPSLGAIPHGVWLGMSVLELLAVVALIVPAFSKRLAILAPIAAAFVAAEMLFFSGYLASGSTESGPAIFGSSWPPFARSSCTDGSSSRRKAPGSNEPSE